MEGIRYSFNVTISPSRYEMGIEAGKKGEELLCRMLREKETVRIIMGSAPSQDDVIAYLRDSTKIDWSRIEVFHMDEYIGISPDDPIAFSNYLQKHLFDHVKVKSFHKVITENRGPEEICEEYSELISEAPIDVVFLGIGENGHLAFNDPAMADFRDPKVMKVVQLDDICRMQQVHDGAFPTLDDVPKSALSLTIPCLMSGAHLVCTVPTSKKNDACVKLMMGAVTAACPATAMRLHPDCNVFLDNESGDGIPEFRGAVTSLS